MPVNALVDHVRNAVPNLIALYRFGSYAQGTATPASDVDIAILAHQALLPSALFVQQRLAVLLHKEVDLIDLHAAPTVLRMQVLSTGECIFSGMGSETSPFTNTQA